MGRFRPSAGVFLLMFQGGTFVDHVDFCLEVTCWERADLLALVCGV